MFVSPHNNDLVGRVLFLFYFVSLFVFIIMARADFCFTLLDLVDPLMRD